MPFEDQPGRLGDHFADERTELPPHLDWEAVGPAIVSAGGRRWSVWAWLLGGVAGAGLLIGMLYYAPAAAPSVPVAPVPYAERAPVRPSAPPPVVPSLPTGEKTDTDGTGVDRPRVAKPPRAVVGIDRAVVTPPVRQRPVGLAAPARLPLGPIAPLAEEAAWSPPAVTAVSAPPAPVSTEHLGSYLSLTAGANRMLIQSRNTSYLPGPFLQLQLTRRLRRQPLFYTVGLTAERIDIRLESDEVEPVTLYRPGTPDTLFTNVITGEQRLVLTDSVAGARRRRLRHHRFDQRIGGQLLLGGRVGRRRLRFTIAGGLGVDYRVGRRGSLLGRYVSVLAQGDDPALRINALAGAGFEYQPGHRLRLHLRGEYVLPVAVMSEHRMRLGLGVGYWLVR